MHELRQKIEEARKLLLTSMGSHARDMLPHEAEEFFRAEVAVMVEELMASHDRGRLSC